MKVVRNADDFVVMVAGKRSDAEALRRAQDAIAEIHYLASPPRNYEWVFEADITACFDEIDHTALLERVRRRMGDKRILGWVKAFLRAGVLTEQGLNRETITGTPQGGILSPLLANIALSVLDEHFAARGPERFHHRVVQIITDCAEGW